MYRLREVKRGTYDDRGYSNEETIANLAITKAAEINNVLTYTYGYDDDRFPLTFLTEGQGSIGTVDIDTVQWTWKTMGRTKFNDYVLWFNTANTTPGKGGAQFEVEFATHWFIEQYGLIAPDGMTQVRIMKDLGPGAHGGYLYRLQITSPNPNAFVDPDLLAAGKDCALQVAAMNPSYLHRAAVPADALEEEKKIQLAQMADDPKMANKPEQVKIKIIEGKLGKFYSENCLLEQAFVKDDKMTVGAYVDSVAKKLGGKIDVVEYVRFERGEGVEKKEDNFADEVASMIK